MKRLFVLLLVACSAPQLPKLPLKPEITLPPSGDRAPSCDTIPTIRAMPNSPFYQYHQAPRFTVNDKVNPSLTGGT